MSGYRFCRSDDVALLTDAFNICYRVHFPQMPPMTVDGFKRAIRELDLWTSSCMVAFSGKQSIGVLLAAKRDSANWIHSVGVHPEHLRGGHGKHMLTSLAQKLAILQPTRMLAELSVSDSVGRAFMGSCGYRPDATYKSFAWPANTDQPAEPSELIQQISVADLFAAGALESSTPRCWRGTVKSLLNLADELTGLAVVSAERIEAYLLYRDLLDEGTREVLAFGSADPAHAQLLLARLLVQCRGTSTSRVLLPQVGADEASADWLEGLGLDEIAQTVAYTADATEIAR
jgi:hypothetical protein